MESTTSDNSWWTETLTVRGDVLSHSSCSKAVMIQQRDNKAVKQKLKRLRVSADAETHLEAESPSTETLLQYVQILHE